MPELPDVEIFRGELEKAAIGESVRSVEIRDAHLIDGISARAFRTNAEGHKLSSTRRHGKYLFVEAGRNGWLIFHFGMTGRFSIFQSGKSEPGKHDHVLFHLGKGKVFAFYCPRKLGSVSHVQDVERFLEKKQLGPDALELDQEGFLRCIDGVRGSLKSLLMNQQRIAGIGNIHSDEILFQAGLAPKAPVSSLDSRKQKELFHEMRDVLKTAIDCDADPGKFPHGYLTGHREADAKCPRCGGKIRKAKVAGWSSYFCLKHQC